MSKQKRKLKQNKVAIDGKIYDVTHPMYAQLYEDKIAPGEIVWDEDNQEWITTAKTAYSTAPRWNPKLSKAKNDEIYEKWQKKQDPDYIANEIRKATGNFATGLAQGVGAFALGAGEIMNTPLAAIGEVVSGRNDFKAILPNMERALSNVGVGEYKGNQQMTPGSALFPNNPIAAGILDIPIDLLTTRGANTLFKQGSKLLSKVPKVNVNKFKNVDEIEYVKNVTSDPRYAQKAKELDVKYSDNVVPERPVNNNLIDQQQTSDFNPFIGQTQTRRTQRMKPYMPSQMFGEFQDKYQFRDAVGPFTKMANYTQTPRYYDKIFTDVDFVDDFLKGLNKDITELTPIELQEAQQLSRRGGIFYPGIEDIQVSRKTAIPHELKHKEHFTKRWSPTFPEKYKQVISQNFDETGDIDDYTKYRLEPVEQEAWLSRDLKKAMVDKGYLETPFDEIDEATLDKFIKTNNEIFTPELIQRLNKPNFLKWVNETLPAATGVTTAGAIGSRLIPQGESAPEQKAYGGKITNVKKNKLPKYQTGGPIDPNLSNRLMQYLFGRNTNKPSILDVRSPNEYGVSFGDRFNIQSGLSFDPMTGMPTGYGKVGINNKGFNLGLEKRKGQSTLNVGYDSPNFNIDATYSNTNKMPSVGGNVGFNTKGFNVGVGGNYSPDNKNISANVGYNNKGFNAGLNYDYSGQSSLSGNVGYGNDLFNVGLSGNYAPGDSNINLNTTYNLGTRKKQKAEPIPLAFNTPEEIQLIKEDAIIDSNEAAGPPKKSYGGKITNMKKKNKNQLPQMNWGGKLAPQLFDLAANALVNSTTYAVTDMIKAIREPEQEMRPTKMNTGMVMANGGMIKRADGSYSKRGLWDNIRANKGSGKKPTKQMLEQEKKIRAAEMAMGGMVTDLNEYGTGGTIKIKPSKRGTFTAAAKKHGKSVQAFASQVLANKDNYSPAMVKKANFARNASKWKHAFGGMITPDMYMQQLMYGSYANGGEVDGDCPPGFVKDFFTGKCVPAPTAQDSTAVYNSTVNFNNALKNAGYNQGWKTNSQDWFNLYNENLRESHKKYTDKVTNTIKQQPNITVRTPSKVIKAKDINPVLNTNVEYVKNVRLPIESHTTNRPMEYIYDDTLPYQLMDYRIEPQNRSLWRKGYIGDENYKVRDFIDYDPVAVKPYADRTSEEHLEFQQKYGNYGGGSKPYDPTFKPLPVPAPVLKYSPEDIEILGKIKGKGLRRSGQWLNLTDADKIAAYKRGSKFEDMPEKDVRGPGYYAMGGQVLQNIPVEVEGGEAYELPNGQIGEFEGPSHDNGGIPVALPEQTKVYSKQLKVNGKTMADRKTKREANVAKLEKILSKNPSDKFVREALKRQQETAALEEQQDMAMQEQANQQQQMQEQAQQGMMQEQAMAGLMQDPAMMQQMGMMMYGGKLANGTPPYGVSNVLPMINNMVKQYNEQINPPYKNTIPPGEGDIYTNFGSYPDVYYRKYVGPDDMMPNYSYFNPKGKQTTWTDIPSTHPAYLQLYNGLKDTNQYYKAGIFPSKGVIKGGLFGQPYTSTNPEVGSTSEPNFDIMGVQPELDVKKKFPQADLSIKTPEIKPINMSRLQPVSLNSVMSLNPNEKYLGNKDGLSVIGGKDDEMLFKNTNPNSSMTGTNPYDAMSNILGQTFENIALSKDPYINTKGGMIPNPFYNEVIGNKMLPEEKGKKPNKFMNFLNEAADKTGDFFSGLFDKNGKPKKEKGTKKDEKGLPLTAGDRMGMAGTLFGGLAPMTTTMLNRMMTPKNQNFFREYGAEGLRAMQEAQALSAINRDKQLADIKLGEEASRQRGRNSARGVNTLRAMDIASDITANQAQNQAYNMYAQQMMQLLGQKAQMENMQDQAVMQGEYTRDLADRQDVDQFYTNLAQNFASQSELMQKQGRDMNQAQYNRMILQMSPMFSKYGIGMDIRNGQYVLTYNGEDIDQTKARLIVEKGIEAEKKAALEKAGTTTGTVTPNTPVAPVSPVAPTTSNTISAINPLGLGHTAYFNPIFTDINIPTVTDQSLIKSVTKRRK